MPLFQPDATRPAEYERFVRETPAWFTDAKLGIFVHWGAYSVAAWAEPIAELGSQEDPHSFVHNSYAEWYYNTIRLEGSPAQEHHRSTFGDAEYDDLLDLWKADKFDADELLALVKSTGAGYFIPTTKHHDGITLWDAPATPRNTVVRGPRRDLIGEMAAATERAGLRFGVYYSGGLDWPFEDLPPIDDSTRSEASEDWEPPRPNNEAYAAYAFNHVADLIERYSPAVLWNDIEWPDSGKSEEAPHSLVRLFDDYYRAVPDGVINDRWGFTHWDYITTEYQMGEPVQGQAWENCRGIGLSFGHNLLEDESNTMSGEQAVRYFVDTVARGGNLLLNIGLQADGTVPELQRRTLEALAEWNTSNGSAIFGSTVLEAEIARPSDDTWVRWTRTDSRANAFIDGEGPILLDLQADAVDVSSARTVDGRSIPAHASDDGVVVELPARAMAGPQVVTFAIRS